MKVSGRALKYGDNINTDVIIPGRYLVLTDPNEMAKHAMEGIDPEFARKVSGGAIMVVGENFGSGSSREQAPIALKHAGVKCIVAKSFARIFYRNAINIGLPVLEAEDVWDGVDEGDELSIDLREGVVFDSSKGREFKAQRLPDFILDLIERGGLLNKLKEMLSKAE